MPYFPTIQLGSIINSNCILADKCQLKKETSSKKAAKTK
jgi:hypothetical protein